LFGPFCEILDLDDPQGSDIMPAPPSQRREPKCFRAPPEPQRLPWFGTVRGRVGVASNVWLLAG